MARRRLARAAAGAGRRRRPAARGVERARRRRGRVRAGDVPGRARGRALRAAVHRSSRLRRPSSALSAQLPLLRDASVAPAARPAGVAARRSLHCSASTSSWRSSRRLHPSPPRTPSPTTRPGPALFESSHELRELWWSWESYQPFTVEMLVLDGFLLWDGVQGAFAPLLLGLAALAAVVGAADRIAGRSVALLAGAVFFAQPFLLWQMTSTFVEPGLALGARARLLEPLALHADREDLVHRPGRALRRRGGGDEVHRHRGCGSCSRPSPPRCCVAGCRPAPSRSPSRVRRWPWHCRGTSRTRCRRAIPSTRSFFGAVNEEATRDVETVLERLRARALTSRCSAPPGPLARRRGRIRPRRPRLAAALPVRAAHAPGAAAPPRRRPRLARDRRLPGCLVRRLPAGPFPRRADARAARSSRRWRWSR